MSQNTEYTVDPSRLVSPDAAPADAAEEVSLRPKTLDDYIGQEKVKVGATIGTHIGPGGITVAFFSTK